MSDLKILKLTDKTLHLLDRVASGVFDEVIRTEQRDAFVAEPSHHMFLAVADNQVVGMISGVKYLHPDKLPSLWVNEVGVGDAWLRQGIGKRLMAAMLELSEKLGCEEAWLGTEPDNVAALALYRAVDGEKETGVNFTWNTEPD